MSPDFWEVESENLKVESEKAMVDKSGNAVQLHSDKQHSAIPLEELIAEIDMETGQADEISGGPKSEDYGSDQYIRFFLEDIPLALPLSSALEIGHRPDITPLPNLPDWIMGVSNIRGEIISIVDLKAFFRLPSHELKRNRRFIIVHNQDMKVGIVVDRIIGIFSLDRTNTDIRNSPYEEGEIASYISGVVISERENKENLLNLLDIVKLLSSPRMNAFRSE